MLLGRLSNEPASNSSTRTVAALDYACANARRKTIEALFWIYPSGAMSNSSTKTAAGPASAFVKAHRKSGRRGVFELPFRRGVEFIDDNGGGPGVRLETRLHRSTKQNWVMSMVEISSRRTVFATDW